MKEYDRITFYVLMALLILAFVIFMLNLFDLNCSREFYEDGAGRITCSYCVPFEPCWEE
jgi:hypothetical protein